MAVGIYILHVVFKQLIHRMYGNQNRLQHIHTIKLSMALTVTQHVI